MKYIIESQETRQRVISEKMHEFHVNGRSLSEALEMAKKWYYGSAWKSDFDELMKKKQGLPAYVRVAPFKEGEKPVTEVKKPKKRNWFKRLFFGKG